MITKEEIKLAQDICANLKEEDYSLLIVTTNSQTELRVLLAGEDKSCDSLLYKLSIWCEQLRSERRKKR